MTKNISIIILSAGNSTRFQDSLPKQFHKINDETILEINLKKIKSFKIINNIILVTSAKHKNKSIKYSRNIPDIIVEGGRTRQLSVKNGLIAAKKFKPEFILIHDCARPFLNEKLVNDLVQNTSLNNGCIPAIKVVDSLRKVKDKKIYKSINRNNLFSIQTPQAFPFKKILKAHVSSKVTNHTDDSSLANENDIPVKIIEGLKNNIKVTTKDDILFLKMINKTEDKFKIGSGFDVHKFVSGKEITLCGIKIPFSKSLKGHSDADVCFHVIVDAILGSISMGDIGDHFPPSDQKWKNCSSEVFMKFAKKELLKKKSVINNLDLTIICEKPKITNYKLRMRKNISRILELNLDDINIKATTTEKLGFTGREEGVAAQAIVSVKCPVLK